MTYCSILWYTIIRCACSCVPQFVLVIRVVLVECCACLMASVTAYVHHDGMFVMSVYVWHYLLWCSSAAFYCVHQVDSTSCLTNVIIKQRTGYIVIGNCQTRWHATHISTMVHTYMHIMYVCIHISLSLYLSIYIYIYIHSIIYRRGNAQCLTNLTKVTSFEYSIL